MKKLFLSCATALALVATPISTYAQTAKSEIVWGDVLPGNLDTHVGFDVLVQMILINAYDGLYRYVGNPPELEPWLAEGHTVSDDGLTWTFTLREGIKFHDGSDMTSEDVVYSFQRLMALGKGAASTFTPIMKAENVTALDDRTIQFVLDTSYAPFLAAMPLVSIINKDLVQANEVDGDWGTAWLASNDAGSGAYVMDMSNYRPQESLTMVRFDDHFFGWSDNPNPVDIVRVNPVRETSTRVLALLNGELDATDSYLGTDQVDRIARSDSAYVSRDESMRLFLITMNNQKAPFDNVNFRKCLSYAMNYDGFISGVLNNLAERNPGPLPRNLWGNPDGLAGYSFDLDKAKEYCDMARAEGAPIDRELEIVSLSGFDQTSQLAQLLQSDAAKIGLNIKIVEQNFNNVLGTLSSADTAPDMWIHWASTYFVDPENWIGQMYDSSLSGSWKQSAFYSNPKVDELLQGARGATDKAKRQPLYEEASKIVVEDAVDIWIYNTVQLRGLANRIDGYKFSPVGSGADFRYLSIKQ
ncbi:MAG: peptide ABC transporter substrate-binding protein [Rhizobiaceae bacterium]|nr:peptide ABC transporter substrate-binding protein [Rhizobiaceae bacterium]